MRPRQTKPYFVCFTSQITELVPNGYTEDRQSVKQFGKLSHLISDSTALVSYHGYPFSTLGFVTKSVEGE